MKDVKYPSVKVQLVGKDGNAFAILGRVHKAIRRSGIDNPTEVWNDFHSEATSGDYNHLLGVVMDWFTVDEKED